MKREIKRRKSIRVVLSHMSLTKKIGFESKVKMVLYFRELICYQPKKLISNLNCLNELALRIYHQI